MSPQPFFDRALPGFSPAYTRTEMSRIGYDQWRVTHFAGDGPGHISAAEVDVYGPLSWAEALDLLAAIYDCLGTE